LIIIYECPASAVFGKLLGSFIDPLITIPPIFTPPIVDDAGRAIDPSSFPLILDKETTGLPLLSNI